MSARLKITMIHTTWAALGNEGGYLRFANDGPAPCELHGWPTVTAVTAAGKTVTVTRAMHGTMLGAWQVNDLDKLHQVYAEDVVIVSGNWAPPSVGWSNFATMYQQQRAHMQQVRMDRSNTYIKVAGTFGWACYQWDFAASIDGQGSAAQGQTTLVLEKQNGKWLIAHNHTSLVQANGALLPVRPANTPSATQPPQR